MTYDNRDDLRQPWWPTTTMRMYVTSHLGWPLIQLDMGSISYLISEFFHLKGARYSNRVWFLKLKNYSQKLPKNSSHMESEVKHEYQIKRNFEIFLAYHN